MSFYQALRMRLSFWWGLFTLVLMSFAAPWLAAYIHSECVFRKGFRMYNAEVGGVYFRGGGAGFGGPSLWDIFTWIGACSVPGLLTLLVLLPLRKRALYRWSVWGCAIALWTWVLFKSEIALR